jgi:hypothetical protein
LNGCLLASDRTDGLSQVNLSWKSEGAKKVQFRSDYRRMVNNDVAEYRTVYVDVVYVKTDLPLKFVHLSPDNRDGDTYQSFTVQTFGKLILPSRCSSLRADLFQVAFRSTVRWTSVMVNVNRTEPIVISTTRPISLEIIHASDSTMSRPVVLMNSVAIPRKSLARYVAEISIKKC